MKSKQAKTPIFHWVRIGGITGLALFASVVDARAQNLTLQGRLLDNSDAPLVEASVDIRVKIYTANSDHCLLYETVINKDLSATKGMFSLDLDGSSDGSVSHGYTLEEAISNLKPFTLAGPLCGGTPAVYTPGPTDTRKVAIEFVPSSGAPAEAIPELDLNPTAYAMEARTVGGFPTTSLLRVMGGGSTPGLAPEFTAAEATELKALGGGSSTKYIQQPSTGGAQVPVRTANPTTLTPGTMWFDDTAGQKVLKYYDGTTVQSVGAGGGGGGAPSGSASGDLGGSYPNPTLDKIQGVTLSVSSLLSGQYLKYNGTNWINAALTLADLPTIDLTKGGTGLTAAGAANQVLGMNAAGTAMEYKTVAAGSNITITPSANTLTISAAAGLSPIGSHTILSNATGASAVPTANSLSYVLDQSFSSNQGSILVRNSTGWSVLAPGTSGYFLQTQGLMADPVWAAAGGGGAPSGSASGDLGGTYPSPSVDKIKGVALSVSSLLSGQYLKYNGTNWINAALTLADLPTIDLTKGGTGLTAAGAANQVLGMNAAGNAMEYKTVTAGSNITITPTANTLTISAASGLSAIGAHTILSNATGSSALPSANSLSYLLDTSFSANQGSILYRNSTGWTVLPPGTNGFVLQTQGLMADPIWAASAGGGGTVTSVDVSAPYMTSSGAITGSGTVALSYASQGTGTVLAAPVGAAGAPTFRSLLKADLRSTAGGNPELFNVAGACAAGTALNFNSVSAQFECSTTTLDQTQVNTAIGYTPVNKAGDSMTGALILPANGLTVGTNQIKVGASGVGIGTASPAYPLHVNGNALFGSALGTIPVAPLNLVNSSAGAMKAQLNLVNAGGGIGAGSAIDFYTYDDASAVAPALRIAGLDNDYSADFLISSKAPGAPANSLVERLRITNQGAVGIGTSAPRASLDLAQRTDALALPRGTTGQQPGSPIAGMIRWNSTTPGLEVYNGSTWAPISTGGGSYLSSSGGTVSGNLTISAGGATITGGVNNNSGGITNAGNITGVGTNITGTSGLTVASGGTNTNLALQSSGTGAVSMGSSNGTSLSVLDGGASTVNYVTVKGAASAAAPVIGTAGSDTDVNLVLAPKGAGLVGLGTSTPAFPLDVRSTSLYTTTPARYAGYFGLTVTPTAGSTTSSRRAGTIGEVIIPSSNTFNPGNIYGAIGSVANDSTGSSARTLTGVMGTATATNSSSVANYLRGVYAYVEQNSSGTSGATIGIYADAWHTQGTSTAFTGAKIDTVINGGTVTTQSGVTITQSSNVAPVNRYGIYIAAPGGVAPTTDDYALYVLGTQASYLAGKVGIGSLAPKVKLDVAGGVKFGNETLCDATTEGTQRYNSTSKIMEFCNGTAWAGFGGGSDSIEWY